MRGDGIGLTISEFGLEGSHIRCETIVFVLSHVYQSIILQNKESGSSIDTGGVLSQVIVAVLNIDEKRIFINVAFAPIDLTVIGDDSIFTVLRSEEHTSELQSRLHLVC